MLTDDGGVGRDQPIPSVSFDFNPYFFGPSALHVLAFDASNSLLGTFDFAQGPVDSGINTEHRSPVARCAS
jgi:hypothetical protein